MRKAASQKANYILLEISILRECINEAGQHSASLSDPVLVLISQMLDERLNRYMELSKSS